MVPTFLLLGLAVDLGLSAALEAGFFEAGLAVEAALEAGLSAAAAFEAGLSAAALVEAGFLLAGFSAAALDAGLAVDLVDLGLAESSSFVFLLAGALAAVSSSAGRFC
jgi:uncharacterized membrane protein YdfJ with MMPL/SSD domain